LKPISRKCSYQEQEDATTQVKNMWKPVSEKAIELIERRESKKGEEAKREGLVTDFQ